MVNELDEEARVQTSFVRGHEWLARMDEVGNPSYYVNNTHGDVLHLTDHKGGIQNSYEYDAFGNTLLIAEQIENRFRYAGETWDSVTQQYYLRARYYKPAIARFTQEDTYRGDGLNLYTYVGNNPIHYVDPSGYMKCDDKGNVYEGNKENISLNNQKPDVLTPQQNEFFYRAMSEKEFKKLEKNNILTKRETGKSELKITDDPYYSSGDLSKRKTQKSRNYTRLVEFEVKPGTKQTLIEEYGGTHISASNHPSFSHLPMHKEGLVEVKFERQRVLSLGLGSSENRLNFFNSQINSWREKNE